jgi:hypothetical protein
LKLAIEKLRRELYGSRSERKARLLDLIELELEELEAAASEDARAAQQAFAEGGQIVRAQPAVAPPVSGSDRAAARAHIRTSVANGEPASLCRLRRFPGDDHHLHHVCRRHDHQRGGGGDGAGVGCDLLGR